MSLGRDKILFLTKIQDCFGYYLPCFCLKETLISRVYINFSEITQKIPAKDIIHWLKLITEILNFMQMFNVRRATTQLISENLQESQQKIYISDIFWQSNKCFFMFSTMHPYLFLYFLIMYSYFHLLFLTLLATRHILQFTMFDSI